MSGDVRRRITSDGAIAGVNIVPVIDLCLVLLVVLVLSCFHFLSSLIDSAKLELCGHGGNTTSGLNGLPNVWYSATNSMRPAVFPGLYE